jgi:hypothetical protein
LTGENLDAITKLGIRKHFATIDKDSQIRLLEALWLAGTQMKMQMSPEGLPVRLMGELAEAIKVGSAEKQHTAALKVLGQTYVGALAKAVERMRPVPVPVPAKSIADPASSPAKSIAEPASVPAKPASGGGGRRSIRVELPTSLGGRRSRVELPTVLGARK